MEKRRKNRIILKHRYRDSRFRRKKTGSSHYNKCIYHKRDMDATERNVVVMKDADILIKICDSTGDFDDTSEYQLLIRLLKERTIIDDGGSRRLRQKRGS